VSLPNSGWRGYGSPNHPYTIRYARNPVADFCRLADEAEARLAHEGIKPELLACLARIGEGLPPCVNW